MAQIPNAHTLSPEEILTRLGLSAAGFFPEEAQACLALFGPNALRAVPPFPGHGDQALRQHIPWFIIPLMAWPLRIEFPGALYHVTARATAGFAVPVALWRTTAASSPKKTPSANLR